MLFFILYRRFQMFMGASLFIFSLLYATDIIRIFLCAMGLSIVGASSMNRLLIWSYFNYTRRFMPDFKRCLKQVGLANTHLLAAQDREAVREYLQALSEMDNNKSKIWMLVAEAFDGLDDKKLKEKSLAFSKKTSRDSKVFWNAFNREISWLNPHSDIRAKHRKYSAPHFGKVNSEIA
jgi:hypothetical protein